MRRLWLTDFDGMTIWVVDANIPCTMLVVRLHE